MPDLGRCGTCAHWAEGSQGTPERGTCQVIPSFDGGPVEALALAAESSGIGTGWVETRAEFGCVLWGRVTEPARQVVLDALLENSDARDDIDARVAADVVMQALADAGYTLPDQATPAASWSHLGEWERGMLDGLRAALLALDGHGFHDTAHDRVRALLACSECGHLPEQHRAGQECTVVVFQPGPPPHPVCECAEWEPKWQDTRPTRSNERRPS